METFSTNVLIMDREIPVQNKSRRRFLASGAGVLGALTTMPNVSLAEQTLPKSSVTHGSRHIVDVKVSYPDASNEIPRGLECLQVPHSVVSDDGLFAVSSPATEFVAESPLLRTPTARRTLDTAVTTTASTPYLNVSYHGSSEGILRSESSPDPIDVDVQIENGRRAVITADGRRLAVPSKTERSVKLPSREFEVPVYGEPEVREIERPDRTVTKEVRPQVGTKAVSATPQLSVRNNGRLTVFGTDDGTVLPASETGLVTSLVGGAETTVQRVEGADVIVVDHDYSEKGGDR